MTLRERLNPRPSLSRSVSPSGSAEPWRTASRSRSGRHGLSPSSEALDHHILALLRERTARLGYPTSKPWSGRTPRDSPRGSTSSASTRASTSEASSRRTTARGTPAIGWWRSPNSWCCCDLLNPRLRARGPGIAQPRCHLLSCERHTGMVMAQAFGAIDSPLRAGTGVPPAPGPQRAAERLPLVGPGAR